ncbi:MAG: hypothetical protein H7288_12700 [Kineosporiaceae bacterium]|nr:hypothetical protein [Aeromicrobium sp.]
MAAARLVRYGQYAFAVGLARMPKVAAVFAGGQISEFTAKSIVNESTGLTAKQAATLDRRLGARVAGLTPCKAGNLARQYAIGIDAAAAYERAKANRPVLIAGQGSCRCFPTRTVSASCRFAARPIPPSTSCREVPPLLSVYKSLEAVAAAAKSAGDTRTRGQVMFDEFVLRATSQKKVTDVNVEVGVIMTTGSLMHTEQAPAMLAGFGPIPAELAHNLIAAGKDVWIRRFFTDEVDGSLVDCDQRRRRFGGKVRHLITTQDRVCRQLGRGATAVWRIAAVEDCSQFDHIVSYLNGGLTTRDNGQGLCGRSHLLKHLPGWCISADKRGDIVWKTSTGHRYNSKRPPVFEYRSDPGQLRQ